MKNQTKVLEELELSKKDRSLEELGSETHLTVNQVRSAIRRLWQRGLIVKRMGFKNIGRIGYKKPPIKQILISVKDKQEIFKRIKTILGRAREEDKLRKNG